MLYVTDYIRQVIYFKARTSNWNLISLTDLNIDLAMIIKCKYKETKLEQIWKAIFNIKSFGTYLQKVLIGIFNTGSVEFDEFIIPLLFFCYSFNKVTKWLSHNWHFFIFGFHSKIGKIEKKNIFIQFTDIIKVNWNVEIGKKKQTEKDHEKQSSNPHWKIRK